MRSAGAQGASSHTLDAPCYTELLATTVNDLAVPPGDRVCWLETPIAGEWTFMAGLEAVGGWVGAMPSLSAPCLTHRLAGFQGSCPCGHGRSGCTYLITCPCPLVSSVYNPQAVRWGGTKRLPAHTTAHMAAGDTGPPRTGGGARVALGPVYGRKA